MWRVSSDSRTTAKFRTHFGVDNLARVAKAWFDEFVPKFHNGGMDPSIDVSNVVKQRQELGCKPFAYFLHRFRKVFIDAAVLSDEIFKIRERNTDKCVKRYGNTYQVHQCSSASWFHFLNLRPPDFPLPEELPQEEEAQPGSDVTCGGHHAPTCAGCPQGHGAGWCNADCTWVFGACVLRIKYESAKSGEEGKKCCSGIREWNTMECFDRPDQNGPLAYFCDTMGKNANQQYLFGEDGRIRHQSGVCISVASDGHRLTTGDCEKASLWERVEARMPEETTLYHQAVSKYNLGDDIPDH